MLIVVGSALTGQGVAQHLVLFLLNQLLELGLVVCVVHLAHRHLHQNEGSDEFLGRFDAAVQETGGNHRLHCIGQDGIPAAAASLLFPMAQHQVVSQVDPGGDGRQGLLADHVRPHPGQLPFGTVREIPVQVFRNQHSQNAVSQKLQPLVAEQAVVPALVGEGGVSQRVLKQGNIMKPIANGLFQILNHGLFAPYMPPVFPGPAAAPGLRHAPRRPWPALPRCGRPARRKSRGP